MRTRSRSIAGLGLLALGALVAMAATAAWAEPAPLVPEAGAWTVAPPLDDKKESENISGVACQPTAVPFRSCLLVGDEKRYARTFALRGTTVVPGDKVTLLPKEEGDVAWDETDAEGIAADGAFYYLVGSHALSRSGELQPSRFFVYRVPVDPATGAPSGAAVRSAGLRNLIEGVAPLRAHAGQPIAAAGSDGHGVNIEGLAVKDGQLYVGLRGPVLDGTAYLLRVAAAPLFAGQPADPRLLPIALGPGRGVRDLAAVASGLLVLAGPEADQGATFALFFWDGSGARPRLLGELRQGQEAKAKPEGLLVLDEDAASYRVLVFHDGARDGAPAAYRVPKAE